MKTAHVEVIRMFLPAGKVRSDCQAPGASIVHFPEEDNTFTTLREPKKLRVGNMLYLAAGKPHKREAVEDSSWLQQIVFQSGGATT